MSSLDQGVISCFVFFTFEYTPTVQWQNNIATYKQKWVYFLKS